MALEIKAYLGQSELKKVEKQYGEYIKNLSDKYKIKVTADTTGIRKVEEQIKKQVQNISGGKGIKLLDTKEIDLYTTKMRNALERLKIGKDSIFAKPEIQKQVEDFNIELDKLGTSGAKSTKELGVQFDTLRTNVLKTAGEFKNVNKDGYNFIQMVELAAKKIAIWGISTGLVYGSLRQLKEGISFINELNKSMTNIAMITGNSHENILQMTKDFSNLATTLHETTSNMMGASEEFLRAGNNAQQTSKLLEASTVMSKIAGQTQEESAQSMIAIMNSFKMNADDMMTVVDKMVAIDNTSATSTRELSAAIKDTAQSAQLAGSSFDAIISYIGTVSSVSRKSADTIGNAFFIGGIAA